MARVCKRLRSSYEENCSNNKNNNFCKEAKDIIEDECSSTSNSNPHNIDPLNPDPHGQVAYAANMVRLLYTLGGSIIILYKGIKSFFRRGDHLRPPSQSPSQPPSLPPSLKNEKANNDEANEQNIDEEEDKKAIKDGN